MKYLVFIFVITLFISCKKTVISSADFAEIKGTIKDVTIAEGVGVYSINLEEIFYIKDDETRIISHKIESISNPSLINVQIEDGLLNIKLNAGITGASTIKLRSEAGEVRKITEFLFTVNAITAQEAMDLAINYFENQQYQLAQSHFILVTRKTDNTLYSDAYLGAGFSKMRSNFSQNDLGYNDFLQSLAFNKNNTAALAGLSLLEYSFNKNYSEAINRGDEVLNLEPNFIFKYDNSLDKNDIQLTVALSQFALKNYLACMQSIQILDPSFSANPMDKDFSQQLLLVLNELISQYS